MASEAYPPRGCRLSVAMIVRDEADVLAATIQSVLPIADEIVVLDTGSTDQTPTVAEQSGAAVRRMPWTDDFSAARNRLLTEVTGDWVLWLDAGERLAAESAAELRNFLDAEADPGKVYLLMVEVPPANPSGSSEQAARPRLMPSSADLRFAGRVCETLKPSMEAAGLQMDAAPGRIVRHPWGHDPQRKARKARRDLKLIALEAAEAVGPQPRLLIAAGEAYSDLDDRAQASRAFLQAIRCAQRGSTEMLECYYGLLTTFDGDPGQRDRQLAVCLEALGIYPLDAQLLSAMGSYLQARNRLDLAARAFETAVTYGTVEVETWHLCEIAEMAAVCLNLTLQLQGKDDQARRVLEETLKRRESSVRVRRHLIDLHVKHGRCDEALRLADAMPMDCQRREPWQDAVRGACSAARQDWTAALGLLQSAYLAGCHDPFCLRWLSVTLLSNGQTEAAEPVLQEWLQLEPNNVEVRAYLDALEQKDAGDDTPRAGRAVGSDQPCPIRIDPPAAVTGITPTEARVINRASSEDSIPDSRG